MRSFVAGAALCFLAGCATVSMVSNEATVETGISLEQSALRKACATYAETTLERGWVTPSKGLAGLANILMNGNSKDAPKAVTYADRIDAKAADTARVETTIITDAQAASLGLADVSAQARLVLTGQDEDATRKDIMSFERALVRAQTSHRNFADAASVLAGRGHDVAAVDAALASLSAEIEAARRIADGLAERYAQVSNANS